MTRGPRTAESRIECAECCRGLFSRLDDQMATIMAAARDVSSTSRMIKRAVVWRHEEFSPCRGANGRTPMELSPVPPAGGYVMMHLRASVGVKAIRHVGDG